MVPVRKECGRKDTSTSKAFPERCRTRCSRRCSRASCACRTNLIIKNEPHEYHHPTQSNQRQRNCPPRHSARLRVEHRENSHSAGLNHAWVSSGDRSSLGDLCRGSVSPVYQGLPARRSPHVPRQWETPETESGFRRSAATAIALRCSLRFLRRSTALS